MKAIIGGTGIDEVLRNSEVKRIQTKFGSVDYQEQDGIVFILRHGVSHDVPPHRVNYRANIEALQLLGVDECISIYCVGSISPEFEVGSCTLMDDFIDFTTRANKTFSHRGNVIHTSMSDLFDKELRSRVLECSKEQNIDMKTGGVYVATEGPRFETKAEIKMYSILGGDFVGMTAVPEVPLLKEKKIKLASIAYSINWCAGINCDEKINFMDDDEIAALSKKLLSISMNSLKKRH
ncbi:MAG: MTAP family purine nucleoside phosphorylase [Sphaerochaeta sp.]